MSARIVFLRCYAKSKNHIWHAICLEYSLAAQDDSFPEVIEKLRQQIDTYFIEMIKGTDKHYRPLLERRRLPLKYWLIFYWYMFLDTVRLLGDKRHVYYEPMPYPLD